MSQKQVALCSSWLGTAPWHPRTLTEALFEGCTVKACWLGLGCKTGGCCSDDAAPRKPTVMTPNTTGIVEENRALAAADHRSESVF